MASKDQSIFRVSKRESPYVVLSKGFLAERSMSWRAKGILAYLLSKPNDWQVMIGDLVQQSTEGRDAVYSALKELEEVGYIVRDSIRRPDGKIAGVEYRVYESPLPEKPDTAEPYPANPTLVYNDNTKNEDTKELSLFSSGARARKKNPPKKGKDFPEYCNGIYEAYPRKVGRVMALHCINKALLRLIGTGMDEKRAFHYLLERTQAYARQRQGSLNDIPAVPNPSTWYNQERYSDLPEDWGPYPYPQNKVGKGFAGKAVVTLGNHDEGF